MLFSLTRAAAAGALILLLSNCSAPGHYPVSGQPASLDDPVQQMQAHDFLFPGLTH
jgi:hypothetical protein